MNLVDQSCPNCDRYKAALNERFTDEALTTRFTVEQAKGYMAASARVSVEDAFQIMRRYARSNETQMVKVCRAVLDGTLPPAVILAYVLAEQKKKASLTGPRPATNHRNSRVSTGLGR